MLRTRRAFLEASLALPVVCGGVSIANARRHPVRSLDRDRRGRIGELLGFQNGDIVDADVANLDKLHAAGTRCIQLTYNARNRIGTGCTEATDSGVTEFGRSVVARWIRYFQDTIGK